ncbi:uracil phosphoribosyltransferase [Chlamydia vaughanii]|uniref:uracil phosphoribosyltransferase n=1 Tax=Chlamydia vaughanii TaxID=3112552 RepID=UPI0032B10E28
MNKFRWGLAVSLFCSLILQNAFVDAASSTKHKKKGHVNVKHLDHPLIQMKLTNMRNTKTDYPEFRNNLMEASAMMVYEALRDYRTKSTEVTTPLNLKARGEAMDKEIVIVPILRAGLGMAEGMLRVVPEARVGHIGLYRDPVTLEAISYYYKVPHVKKDSTVLIVDPMFATGNTSVSAVKQLQKDGFTDIRLVCLLGVQEAIRNLEDNGIDIDLYIAAIDDGLNEKAYILPGLGDSGDRVFGTYLSLDDAQEHIGVK